jgi:hypothetical protein
MPHVLILSLKRTTFDGNNEAGKKDLLNISFTENVTLTQLDGIVTYVLFAVCEHSGASSGSGHYTTLARLPKKGGTFHDWYKYDDIKKPEMCMRGVPFSRNYQNNNNAFNLCYTKQTNE